MCLSLAAAAICCQIAAAEEPNPFAELRGDYTFKLEPGSTSTYGLDAAGRHSAHEAIQRLNDILRASPVMNPPRGFLVRSTGRGLTGSSYCPNGQCAGSVVASEVWLLLYYYVAGQDGKPTWGDELNVAMHAYINSLQETVTQRHQMHYEEIRDLGGHTMYYEPRRTRSIGGFPVFDDSVLVVTKSRRPLWLPVSRETFLRALIRDTKRDMAQIGMTGSDLDMGLRQRVGRLQAELETLPPGMRSSQAWHVASEDPMESGLAAPETADARPVIILNPDFFDRSLPRTAVQIVAARLNWGTHFDVESRSIDTINADDHVSVQRLSQLLNQTDWARVAELVVEQGR